MRSPGLALPIRRVNGASPWRASSASVRPKSALAHLQHGAELFREQGGIGPLEGAELHVDRGATRERHLEQRDREPAVRAVVVREQEPRIAQFADRGEERCEPRGVVDVGRQVAGPAVDLREAGTADAVAPAAEVDQDEGRRPRVADEGRRECPPHVADRRTGRDHHRERRVTACTPAASRQLVRMESESLPTGIAMPSAGHSASPRACTVS